jgi:hypothetical protein
MFHRFYRLWVNSRFAAVNHVKVPISMNLAVAQILSHLGHKDTDFFERPAQSASEQSQAHGFATPTEILHGPLAKLFVLGVSWPGIDGPLDRDADDVCEAGIAHHVGYLADGIEGEAGPGCALVHVVVPLGQRGVGCQCTVVAANDKVDVVEFQVAAIFKKPRGSGEFVCAM